MSTAKERRLAKRAADRAADDGLPLEPSLHAALVEPAPAAAKEAMTAKERQLAQRAAARAAGAGAPAVSSAAAASSPPPAAVAVVSAAAAAAATTPMEGLSAKERRLAKRAAERASAGATQAGASAAALSAAAAGAFETTEGMTAKERRLARRAADRAAVVQGTSGKAPAAAPTAPEGGDAASSAKHAKGGPFIVFVGQLTFRTTTQQLDEHFRTKGGIEGALKIRLRTHPQTKRSLGQAFVEVDDPATMYHCLTLHHTRLDGRIINVERSTGGGGESRKRKLDSLREEQKEHMRQTVARILREHIDKGLLKAGELDDDAVRVLEKFEGKVVEKALADYCAKPDKATLRNKSAYFVHITHNIAFKEEVDEKDLQEARAKLKAGGAAQGPAGARGGGANAAHTPRQGAPPQKRVHADQAGGRGGAAAGPRASSAASGSANGDRGGEEGGGALERRKAAVGVESAEHGGPGARGAGSGASSLVSIFPSLRNRGGGAMNRGGRGPPQGRAALAAADAAAAERGEATGTAEKEEAYAAEGVNGDGTDGMAAKERRMAKRAAAREAAAAAAGQ